MRARHGRVAGANTNLGIVLLLAPLARAALLGGPLRDRLAEVLDGLTLDDARAAYTAILEAGAGGLDDPVEHDVHAAPTVALRRRDGRRGPPGLDRSRVLHVLRRDVRARASGARPRARRGLRPRDATVELSLELLAAVPDTLVARKRGRRAAERVSAGAARVLAAGGVRDDAGRAALEGSTPRCGRTATR